jgi:molecular chaperone DnaK (HSP70)
MTDEAPAVGIDLGTTYSCVAVFQNGRVKIIPNENGYRITPSYVSFTADGHIVGDDAKYRVTMNPRNTVFEVKRLIGIPFDEPSVARDTSYWPFEVANEDNKPKIVVYPGGDQPVQRYTPEEISAKILQKMKTIAEKYLKKVRK